MPNAKRAINSKTKNRKLAAKRVVKRSRPVHKRVLLHPISAFLLLCIGVLVAGSTFHGRAATYDVTASVPAASLTSPAVITSPHHQQRSASNEFEVTGICPAGSYVKVYRNAVFSGVSACIDEHFSVRTQLTVGANELKARAFNVTNQEGPSSPSVVAYFDVPVTVPRPAAAPTTLQVSGIEQASYRDGTIPEVSESPTVSGLAPPHASITVTFYSIPSICKTKADAYGVWSCTLPSSLAAGKHEVVITAQTTDGRTLIFPPFQITVAAAPFDIIAEYTYQSRRAGQPFSWDVAVQGGVAPYQLEVDWGDGNTSHTTTANTAPLSITHSYEAPTTLQKTHAVFVRATDKAGKRASVQLSAVVQGDFAPAAYSQSSLAALMSKIKEWMWIIGPAYMGVLLMALSFWIGEQEAYRRFLARSSKRTR